jgi:predicted transcriptional regulator of viral defense system
MAISLKTWGEQLEEVQKAISTVLVNQRYEINGRYVQRADLEWLQKREVYLVDKLQNEGDVIPTQRPMRGVFNVEFT